MAVVIEFQKDLLILLERLASFTPVQESVFSKKGSSHSLAGGEEAADDFVLWPELIEDSGYQMFIVREEIANLAKCRDDLRDERDRYSDRIETILDLRRRDRETMDHLEALREEKMDLTRQLMELGVS
jgi:hypothetical protein